MYALLASRVVVERCWLWADVSKGMELQAASAVPYSDRLSERPAPQPISFAGKMRIHIRNYDNTEKASRLGFSQNFTRILF